MLNQQPMRTVLRTASLLRYPSFPMQRVGSVQIELTALTERLVAMLRVLLRPPTLREKCRHGVLELRYAWQKNHKSLILWRREGANLTPVFRTRKLLIPESLKSLKSPEATSSGTNLAQRRPNAVCGS
jgi:hypothetical protein